MFSLIPKDEKYFTMLSELATRVHSGTEVFVKIFDDYDNRTRYADEIKGIEVACDTIAARITGRLNSSFITPIDREDIYLLVKELDDVIDTVNSLAIRFDMYSVHILRPEAREMAEILRLATAELEGAFHLLEKNQNISEHCKQINVLENRGDKLYRTSIKDLFIKEKDAIEVIKWMAIYEALETAVDRCKDVAETVEAVVVKNK
jgi:predicted phosphate transport protein (TIGR00153 family)